MTRTSRLVTTTVRQIADTARRMAPHLQRSLGLTIEHYRHSHLAWWSIARLGDYPRPGDRGRVFALVHVADEYNMETLRPIRSRWRFYFRVGPKGYALKRRLDIELNYEVTIPSGWPFHPR